MLFVIALVLAWVPSPAVASGLPSAYGPTGVMQGENGPGEVTVTDRHTEGFFTVPQKILNEPPPVLRLRVTKVVNPDNTAFQIVISLSAGAEREKGAVGTSIPLGHVGLFPADRPGAFLLRDTAAFEKLKASLPTGKRGSAKLMVNIERLHENKPWTRVEVTIAPPEWIADQGQALGRSHALTCPVPVLEEFLLPGCSQTKQPASGPFEIALDLAVSAPMSTRSVYPRP